MKLRELRVYVDRPEFILNPTDCDPSQVRATLFGSYLDVFDPADDLPVPCRAATRPPAAPACPKGAVYGHVKAFTPLLDEPLAGPVYLRSSNHKPPDLVFDLRGLIVNSRNLCAHSSRVQVLFDAHNGKAESLHPLLRPSCNRRAKHRRRWKPRVRKSSRAPICTREKSSHGICRQNRARRSRRSALRPQSLGKS